ncbi:hypothetical protein GQ457_17G027330 [Hibiscus cannabinus]
MNALNFGRTGGVLHNVQNVVDPGLMANGFGNLAQGPANQNGLNFGGHGGGMSPVSSPPVNLEGELFRTVIPNNIFNTGFGNLSEGPGNQNALNFGVGGGGFENLAQGPVNQNPLNLGGDPGAGLTFHRTTLQYRSLHHVDSILNIVLKLKV